MAAGSVHASRWALDGRREGTCRGVVGASSTEGKKAVRQAGRPAHRIGPRWCVMRINNGFAGVFVIAHSGDVSTKRIINDFGKTVVVGVPSRITKERTTVANYTSIA